MYRFVPHPDKKLTKIQQIVKAVKTDIEKGILEADFQLPSINDFSEKYGVARDTIEKAYRELKKDGFVASVAGKGYFVLGKKEKRLKVLLVFNKLSSYKRILYDSILETFGTTAKVDLQIHHYNPQLLKEILESSKDNYHYYVVMPHFFYDSKKEQYLKILKKVPENKLVLLDKMLPELEGEYMAVYQNFRQDIFDALTSSTDLLEKYEKLLLVFPKFKHYPLEITEGSEMFCQENNKEFKIIDSTASEKVEKGSVYLVTSDADLANIIKKIKTSGFVLGTDVGIISFNETVLKELLDITVITTDFEAMGRTAATLILNKNFSKVKNPFTVIRRGSI